MSGEVYQKPAANGLPRKPVAWSDKRRSTVSGTSIAAEARMVNFRAFIAWCVLALLPATALAQGGYFGRNKVQYQEFDFKVLKTEHFDIYFYPEEEEGARMAARMAERWYARLSKLMNHELRGRQPLVLYASPAHFWQTTAIQGEIGEGTGGVTEAYKRRIVLPLAGPIEATDHVLGHELVHAFQYDITSTNVSSGNAGALALPLWFIEGMAEYLSIGPVDPHTAMWMREAARREKLPTIDELDNPRYFPYRYGHALWAYIGGRFGDQVIADMLRAAAGTRGGYPVAFEAVLQAETKQLSKEWHDALFQAYRPIAESTKMPGEIARSVIKNRRPGELNVSPEISPDGSRVMFFSERDLFSIDLYVADAKTGEIIRKVTDTATDAHTESLQFLSSAGSWDKAGKRFVFPGISRGQPLLTIVDVDNGRTEREIRVPEVQEIVNPAWSPDGKLIAFSGLIGGFNDLFVYDLDASQVRRLTTDTFADLDPAWSPDGRMLAFSTDRFTTNLQTIESGELRLAVLDMASGQVRAAGGFENAKNISPQWTADGRALFFLSDRGGVTNIYRTEFGGATTQLTNLLTGASGITALSPALSVSNNSLVFSAYEDDGYTIYALDNPTQLTGGEQIALPQNAAVLPPRQAGDGPVYVALENETLGLPAAAATPPVEEYKPKFGLDFAGQPVIGVGTDPFGTYAAGGMSFLFSDMLGNHSLGVGAQVTSRFDEFGGSLFYVNRKHRWNWGVAIDQTPYVSRGFSAGVTVIQGIPVYEENEYRILQIDRSFTGILSYPFSRSQRVDFSGGFRQIGFKQDVTQRLYDFNTGQQLTEEETDLGSEPWLNLGEASAALVFDTSIHGITSPIRGSRYRVEVSQTGGSLNYTGLLGDFRSYLMPFRPYTFALRGMYYGRYGSDAEDTRLPLMYLGYPGLVRGYDSGSFESFECGLQIDGSCPAFDRLFGSRLALANVELRFPLWGAFGGSNFYGPLPIEMAVFADAGVAWGQSGSTLFGGGEKEPVSSVGAAIRVNLFGFAVGEVDYVKPLQRPEKGWMWQFNLRPGF
jgi:Tol biopolymer transport system component